MPIIILYDRSILYAMCLFSFGNKNNLPKSPSQYGGIAKDGQREPMSGERWYPDITSFWRCPDLDNHTAVHGYFGCPT